MTMTDPIADMLTRSATRTSRSTTRSLMPSSKLKEALARILEQEGYIEGFDVEDDRRVPGSKLTIALKYTPDRKRTISGIERVSKPGPAGVHEGRPTCPACSAAWASPILSTNQGLMTDREARQRRVGGEVLCQVW